MKKRHLVKAFLCILLLPLFLLSSYGAAAEDESGAEQPAYDLSYVSTLFDTSYVHTIDIRLTEGEWDDFIATCTDKAYWACDLTIDGEEFPNAAIRAKGNSSMQMVGNSGKYSFKIEFDHYSDNTYHGLDKLNLNNMVKDDASMRDYLVYRTMDLFGVDAPLCSYIFVTVNGEDWGLYLALEGVEDAFLQRNYGADTGDLYKPDSISNHKGDDDEDDTASGDMGGAPQFGGQHPGASGEASADRSASGENNAAASAETQTASGETAGASDESASGEASSDASSEQHGFAPGGGGAPAGGGPGGGGGGGGGFGGSGMGTDDVKLLYIDDDPDSYPYIFDSAKTDVTRADEYRLIGALQRLNAQEDLEDTLDIEEVLRYFAAHIFVCNSDSYTGNMIHNYYLREADGQLSMIPWDYNQAFSIDSDDVNAPIDTPTTVDMSELPMISWIFDDPDYTEQYHATFLEYIDRFCTSGWMEETIRETEEMIAPYIARDPNAFCTEDEFHEAADELSVFCRLRAESVLGQLSGSVPSTDDTQSAEPDRLIDTTELTGSSGSFGGPGGGFPGGAGGASGGPGGGFPGSSAEASGG